ncbi:hypothetical protein NORO109296_11395 [Nocardiopsis rhodophaea]
MNPSVRRTEQATGRNRSSIPNRGYRSGRSRRVRPYVRAIVGPVV